MQIEQFEDKALAHFAYAILVDKTITLIDPARNPQPYYDFAKKHDAKIIGVIETHPHADFVSSHLEIHETTGATIYVSKLVGADYPHKAFDEGDEIKLNKNIKLKALHTPGHSPDSITILLEEKGKLLAAFTGDTLFIGDVGRPDLREKAGNMHAKREELARMMYKTTREKLMKLPDEVLVYPAHGAGSLCGKALKSANSSTIGEEKADNYALQPMSEEEFVALLLEDQPFIPKYFGYNVDLNKKGAPHFRKSVDAVRHLDNNFQPKLDDKVIVDTRPDAAFKASHLEGAINIMDGGKFETWLGSVVSPEENFYLVAKSAEDLERLIERSAKIGYELLTKGAFVYNNDNGKQLATFDKAAFDAHRDDFTIIDVRNPSEVKDKKVFENTLEIPLPELRDRLNEIPKDKPIYIHCAGGYRSAAAASIVQQAIPEQKVYDVSEAVLTY
ncbi:MAG: MBL fold metallo-hydrolase [Bernardetiaceae bacterium]|nr:MBL fold metallo-hydrolase [Bernardetiaceae bacterium]